MSCTVSVITAAYNRANTLPRLYESLKAQTNRDFEWILVDDGSTDNTREIMECIAKEAPFKVHNIHKENGGWHTARNIGIKQAAGRIIVPIDSDDTLAANTIEYAITEGTKLFSSEDLFAIRARCIYENGELVGKPFPDDINSWQMKRKRRWVRKNSCECIYILRTDIMKQNLFPEPDGMRFIIAGMLWDELHAKYDCYYVNQVLRTYYQDQDDQVTKSIPKWNSYYRYYIYSIKLFNRIFEIDKTFSINEKANLFHKFLAICYKMTMKLSEILKDVKNPSYKVLFTAFYPLYCVAGRVMGKKREHREHRGTVLLCHLTNKRVRCCNGKSKAWI